MSDVLASMDVPVVEPPADECVDEFPSACSVAILGIGQAGGRIADVAWRMGFRKVLAINTSQGDLDGLDALPADRRFLYGSGGAGKNPDNGRAQFAAAAGDVLDHMLDKMGRSVELVLVAVGAGGGTGSGAILPPAEGQRNAFGVSEAFLKVCGSERHRVGAIVTLPEPAEGSEPAAHARRIIESLLPAEADTDRPAMPVIMVDNARIARLFPRIKITEKWERVNRTILMPLQAFLTLTARRPAAYNFDVADLWRVLGSWRLALGAFDVSAATATTLSQAVRNGIANGMSAGGFGVGKDTDAAILFAGSKSAIGAIASDDLEFAARAMAAICPMATIHRGVYEVDGIEGLKVFTAIGGTDAPAWPAA